jgi:hypothetical protein
VVGTTGGQTKKKEESQRDNARELHGIHPWIF